MGCKIQGRAWEGEREGDHRLNSHAMSLCGRKTGCDDRGSGHGGYISTGYNNRKKEKCYNFLVSQMNDISEALYKLSNQRAWNTTIDLWPELDEESTSAI